MKDKISDMFTFILTIVIIWFEFAGIYHSFKEHSIPDGLISVVIPPVAWYRSIELFWHDDFSDIDWDKALKIDLENSIYLLNYSISDGANIIKLNNLIVEFSNKINKYPNEKLLYIRNNTKIYINYYLNFIQDFKNSFIEYKKTGHFKFILSKKTKKLEKKLIELNLLEQVISTKEEIKYFENEMEKLKKNKSIEYIKTEEYFFKNIDLIYNKFALKLKKTYKKIFLMDFK